MVDDPAVRDESVKAMAQPALRLGHFFGTMEEFWLKLQQLCELRRAEQKSRVAIPRRANLRAGVCRRAMGR